MRSWGDMDPLTSRHSPPWRRATVGGLTLATEQIQLLAQQHELTEHWAEGLAVIAAEISDGLEVGLQVTQQPDDLDIAVGLGFQAAA